MAGREFAFVGSVDPTYLTEPSAPICFCRSLRIPHTALGYTNFLAICSSRISLTVRARIMMPVRLKNAPISVMASLE